MTQEHDTFRGLVILGGVVTLGFLWGSFIWLLTDYNFPPPLRTFVWSVVVSITFVVIIRVWDAWYAHAKVGKVNEQLSGDFLD